jgi:hypothetical protein
MKNTIKLFSAIVLFLTIISHTTYGQTPVSGGIYSNTTWTLANSPYIVTDTVVVFPGVTLTIEPGVTVKFNNGGLLEIRQASLIAVGTVSDSITFTSNSSSPFAGIWNEIHISSNSTVSQFSYCNILYASTGIYNNYLNGSLNYIADIQVSNSKFTKNICCIYCIGNYGSYTSVETSLFHNNSIAFRGSNIKINFCNISYNQTGINIDPYAYTFFFINNSTIHSNQYGISGHAASGAAFYSLKNSIIDCNNIAGLVLGGYSSQMDTVYNCVFRNNATGITDTNGSGMFMTHCIVSDNIYGIKLKNSNKTMSCNKICNNAIYDIYCKNSFSTNLDIPGNYWCTSDSNIIAAKIFDGYDNVNLSLVNFMPVDMTLCYSIGVTNPSDTGLCNSPGCIMQVTALVTNATCDTCHDGSATGFAVNGFPPYTWTWYTSPMQTTQTAIGLAPGTYMLCVTDSHGCTVCNPSVFVDSTNCNGFSITAQASNANCSTCPDGKAWVNIAGGTPPYSYTWYTTPMQNTDTATGLLPGTYGVCVTDFYGCVVCDTAMVSTGSCSAYFDLYPDSITLHQYYAVNYAFGTPPLTYYWNWGDGTFDVVPYPTHAYSTAGFYAICLTITDSAGCTDTYCNSYYLQKSTNSMVYINVITPETVGIIENSEDNSIFLYPNPATNLLTIETSQTTKGSTVSIYNIDGQELIKQQMNESKIQIDISKLKSGIYFVKVSNENAVEVRKIIKE